MTLKIGFFIGKNSYFLAAAVIFRWTVSSVVWERLFVLLWMTLPAQQPCCWEGILVDGFCMLVFVSNLIATGAVGLVAEAEIAALATNFICFSFVGFWSCICRLTMALPNSFFSSLTFSSWARLLSALH
jgi:hypothetical protein